MTGYVCAQFYCSCLSPSKGFDCLQVENVRNAFISFFCVLCAYFLQLPTRDESGVALGMHAPCERTRDMQNI